MPIVSVRAFAPLMRQRVSIKAKTGYDDRGGATYGSPTVYQCAVVGEMKVVTSESGEQVPSRQAIYLMSAAAVRPEDHVTLSTGDVGSTESYALTPKIIAVERYPFTRGQFVTVVRLGSGVS